MRGIVDLDTVLLVLDLLIEIGGQAIAIGDHLSAKSSSERSDGHEDATRGVYEPIVGFGGARGALCC
jgi:hypothetical protein